MRILIPVDDHPLSETILRFLAARPGLLRKSPRIELVNVQLPMPRAISERFGDEAVSRVLSEEGERVFASLEGVLKELDLAVEKRVLVGERGPAIAAEAERFKADLILMGARGRSPMKTLLLGSVSTSVLEYAHVPVLLVQEMPILEKSRLSATLAVDGSDYGEAAAAFMAAEPEFFGPATHVDVLYVAPDAAERAAGEETDFVTVHDEFMKRTAEWDAEARRATESVVKTLAEAGFDAQAVVLAGDPAQKIAEHASEKSDMIVMGSHGWGEFKSAVLGSTAMKVASETKLPILVIRH